MNKTVTVNLGGTVFHIDDNAYEALTKYLNAIKSRFSAEQGRDEIMQDIESRIGEMFSDRMKDGRQVITLTDVEEVTRLMGRPEEFAEEGTASQETTSSATEGTQQYKRRMFRNPDDRLLGGVCSGIAAYFDIDAVWVRLGFVLFFFAWGTGVLLYFLLWIILPKAKTTADKLMMKGEPVTISNIEKNVREELNAVQQQMKDGKGESVFRRIFDAIGEVFKYIFIIIGKIIAAFFLLIGVVVAFALFASLFGLVGAPFVHYPESFNHVLENHSAFGWALFGVVLFVGIPFLMLAYAGARTLFHIKKGSRVVGFSALALWLVGVVLILSLGLRAAHEFKERDSIRREVTLQQPANKYLVLKSDAKQTTEKDYDEPHSGINTDDNWDMEVMNERLLSSNVKLDVVKSPTDSFDVVEILYSSGPSRKEAVENASRIIYSFSQSEGELKFDRHYSMNSSEKWRNQRVQLLLRVPVGGKVRFDKGLRHLIYDIDNIQKIRDNDMLDRTWQMTEKGLTCVDCTGMERTVGETVDINSGDGDQVKIDESGVHIKSKDGDSVSIDNRGIRAHSRGKQVIKIDEDGVRINADSSATKK